MESNENINEDINEGGRIEATDDVEGHVIRPKGLVEDNAEDITEDVEGHGAYSGRIAEEPTDDVEGHAVRGNG